MQADESVADTNCAGAVLVGNSQTSGVELGLWYNLCFGDRKNETQRS